MIYYPKANITLFCIIFLAMMQALIEFIYMYQTFPNQIIKWSKSKFKWIEEHCVDNWAEMWPVLIPRTQGYSVCACTQEDLIWLQPGN